MQYRTLGKTDLRVSIISFGAWAIGGLNWGRTDDEESKRALNWALELGVNYIDTADVYGLGHSEELIGEVLQEHKGEEIYVATKVGKYFYKAGEEESRGYLFFPFRVDKDYIIWAAEQSLKRLKRDYIDVLQLHSPDTELVNRDEPWEALDKLRRDGKIRFAGWSVQSFKETEQAFIVEKFAEVLDVIQVRYNLLEREPEKELLPKAEKYNIGVVVRTPLLFGLLTGKFGPETEFSSDDHRRINLAPEKLRNYLNQLEKLKPLFEKYPDQTKAQVSLRFCITHKACHLAIPGAKTVKHVEDNCRASDLGPLTEEDLEIIEQAK